MLDQLTQNLIDAFENGEIIPSDQDEKMIAREMEDLKLKIKGTDIDKYLNDLADYPTRIDSVDPEIFPNTLVGRIRQWLRPRLKHEPSSNAQGSLLNNASQKGTQQPKNASQTSADAKRVASAF